MPCAAALDCNCHDAPRGAGALLSTSRTLEAAADFAAVTNYQATARAAAPYTYQAETPAEEPMPFKTQQYAETPRELLEALETEWPVGCRAQLFAPFEVDRGLWVQPRLVSTFVKTSNGRWTSYPGNDVSYPTLGALALAAPVMDVYCPQQGQPAPTPEAPAVYIPEIVAPDYSPPSVLIDVDSVPDAQAQAGRVPWLLIGAGAVAFWFFAGRRKG